MKEDRFLRSSGMTDIFLHHDGRIRVIEPYWHKDREGWEECPELQADGTIKWKHPERIMPGVARETLIAFEMIEEEKNNPPEEIKTEFEDIFDGLGI